MLRNCIPNFPLTAIMRTRIGNRSRAFTTLTGSSRLGGLMGSDPFGPVHSGIESRSNGSRNLQDRLKGKAIIVVGSGSGIGAATAKRLASEGARVCLADINQTGAGKVAAEIAGEGGD